MKNFKHIQNWKNLHNNPPITISQLQHVTLWSDMFHPYLLPHPITPKVIFKYITYFITFPLLMVSRQMPSGTNL